MSPAVSRPVPPADTHATTVVRLPEILSAGGGPTGAVCPQHDHLGDELVLVTAGTVTVQSGEATFTGKPGTLFLFPRGVFHDQLSAPGTQSWYVVFRCPGRAFPRAPLAIELANDDPVHGWLPQVVRCHLEPGAAARVGRMLLLALLERLGALAEQRTLPAPLSAALRHLEAHPTEDVPAEQLAQVAGISPSHLRTLFRQHLGVSAQDHHARLRLELAAKLLRSSYLSMAEVAAAVGWSDANYFARRFAQHYGKRPRAWRQEHRA